MSRYRRIATLALLGCAALAAPVASADDPGSVDKATLRNGLRVVIVRNALGPVVATDLTYLVGSRDDPAGFTGLAHAQEHMLFRGTKNLSTSELGTVATALGGDFNAATSDLTTQYQFTVPAADLDAVLRIESDRMRDVLDLQSQWQDERGAIEQEVLRDASEPGGDFFDDAKQIAFAGTTFARDGVGTNAAFNALTGPRLKAFYRKWYAPNNAVLVIAGDVDPERTLAQVRARFDSIPAHPVPAHIVAHFRPLHRTIIRRTSTLVYPFAAIGYRLPGIDSPDFLAAFVLQGILDSARGDIHTLADSGEVLDAQWVSLPYFNEGQLGLATAALRPGADPVHDAAILEARVEGYARSGVPRELFESTKHQLIVGQEESRNSIESLASDWATTIAVDREPSIAREQQLIAAVTLADVDRVAQRYLRADAAIVGALTPSGNASRNQAPQTPATGPEKPLNAQPPVTHLPGWAQNLVDHIALPPAAAQPYRTTLANGIDLIVQPESISDSVFVFGNVKTVPALQEPPDKAGVSSVLSNIFDSGTIRLDRLGFARAQDDANSQISGGTSFGVETTSHDFDHAIDLLGQVELTPRFDQTTFAQAQQRAADELQTALNGSIAISERRAAQYLLPPGDPELRDPTVRDIEALTLDDVTAYYKNVMRPDLTTVVVVGNIRPEDAVRALTRAFADWHADGDKPDLTLAPLPLNPAGEVHLQLPVAQDSVTFRQNVDIATNDRARYALELGNAIFGGGALGPEQSRLFRDLRQNAGLVYSIGSQLVPDRERYRLSIDFACSPGNQTRITKLIDREIERMQTAPAGAFELALAKASIVRQGVLTGGSVSGIGGTLLGAATQKRPFDQSRIDAQAILDTDATAIQTTFAAAIHPDHFVRIIEGP